MVVISEISSSSSSTLVHKYDVFLSFRGSDTRYSFTDHLYNTLMNANITTFLDDEEIETGLSLKPELEIAIRSSRASIIVLSQNYASSSWCLNQLVLILEQLRNSDHIVIPIFYHVKPTDVRKQQNSFGEAMAEHKQRMETEANEDKRSEWAQKIDLWKNALKDVADLKGEYIGKDRRETIFIEEIVTKIHRRLGGPAKVCLPLIGMDLHIEYITIWLKDGSSHTADILTISGMSGIGKTTLAKYVYRLNCREFQRSSFIEGISGTCAKKYNGLLDLQKQICGDISKPEGSSSSSSSLMIARIYDVFLSFRGIDTRNNFTDHLYTTLRKTDIATFLDEDEIETGLPLKPELESAIKASRASIIVLSENYASSTWCLDELVLILAQQRTFGHIVIPIFYHVEPTDVRKQQSSFGDAMAKHKERMEIETNAEIKSQWFQKIELWKEALEEVADLKGLNAEGRKETELIVEIVAHIYRVLGVPLSTPQSLFIGMHRHINFIRLWLEDRSSTVDILTILGMNGIVKTSLAKYVYRLSCRMFQWSCFIEDIRRSCYADQVQDDFVNASGIRDVPGQRKVFLVLDGIDSLDQLDVLLGNTTFHPGSKIIIMTNDKSLTAKCALFRQTVKPRHIQLLLGGLDECECESLKLFSIHAFRCKYLKEGYERMSKTHVKYCQGLPWAVRVLGESLCNANLDVWEDFINKQEKEINYRIRMRLKRSFDSLLSDNDKELFKHIACFFVGKDRESIKAILAACDIHTDHGIETLIDRCLLRIGGQNKLMMHQLLQKLGQDLVYQESPNKPEKRSRLWHHKESFKVLKKNKGNGNLRGLALDMRMLEKDKSYELKTNALNGMDNLMLLQLNHVHQLKGSSYKKFPDELRWLCMHGFPLMSIPSGLPMENLVALDMSHSNFESFDMSCNSQRPRKRQKVRNLKTMERPPCKLKDLIFDEWHSQQKIVFFREKFPLAFSMNPWCTSHPKCYIIEGMLKVEAIEHVAEEVLGSLGWTNLELVDKQQMVYEFGIFSTTYGGEEVPDWISDRRKGSSIDFAIPSSRNNLRGLSFCYVFMARRPCYLYLPRISISNMTKNRTWIYECYSYSVVSPDAKCEIFLSHWMFGKNEMEAEDQITITISEEDGNGTGIRECGVTLVYDDDGKKKMEEEDVLHYYKSWDHIIGGDLSPFEATTPGEYLLDGRRFFLWD